MIYTDKIINNRLGNYTFSKKLADKLGYQFVLNEQETEKGFDGLLYLTGFAPHETEKNNIEKRRLEYPPISDQLDMIYWDAINGTSLWKNKITEIKNKYPKE